MDRNEGHVQQPQPSQQEQNIIMGELEDGAIVEKELDYSSDRDIPVISHTNKDPKEQERMNRGTYFKLLNIKEANRRKERNEEIATQIKNKNANSIQERIKILTGRIQYAKMKLQEYQNSISRNEQSTRRKADLAVQWQNNPTHYLDIAIVMSQGETMQTTLNKKYKEKLNTYKKYQLENEGLSIIPLLFTSQGAIDQRTENYLTTILQRTKHEQWKRIWNNYKLQIMATIVRYTAINAVQWIYDQNQYEYPHKEEIHVGAKPGRMVTETTNTCTRIDGLQINSANSTNMTASA